MTLGENIKKFREARGLLQKELAFHIGMSDKQISRIEKGVQNNPRIQTVIKLAEILEVSIDELVSEKEIKTDKQAALQFQRLSKTDKTTVNRIIKGFLDKEI